MKKSQNYLVGLQVLPGVVGLGMALFSAERGMAAEALRPNIVIIVADDLGYQDVGFTGCTEIKTPNVDKLAAAGAKLEQFYVQPLCSPTRGALMTGRYPIRLGLQVGVIRPWEKRGLPLEERILPQALKQAGYTTAISGKWHLGMDQGYLPTQRGFDSQYGHYCGALDYFTHDRMGGFDWHRNDKVCRDEGYSTHLIAREAVRVITQQPKDKPLFLYVPFNAVHDPHQVPEKYKEPYAGLKEPRRTYAGMVAAMDEAIGQILGAIDEKGIRRKTLIFFSSDNGGPRPGVVTSNGPLRAGKGTVYEGGTHVCACVAWEGRIKAGSSIAQPLHIIDWCPTLLKLAGAPLEQKLPLDGKDIWPVLTEGKPSPHSEILINATSRGGAIRCGDWKLVVNGGASIMDEGDQAPKAGKKKKGKQPAERKPAELFNLAKDMGEKNDLSAANPEKVKELMARYEACAKQAVEPLNEPMPAGFKAPKVWGEKK